MQVVQFKNVISAQKASHVANANGLVLAWIYTN